MSRLLRHLLVPTARARRDRARRTAMLNEKHYAGMQRSSNPFSAATDYRLGIRCNESLAIDRRLLTIPIPATPLAF